MVLNERQDMLSTLVAARKFVSHELTLIQELRETYNDRLRYISARVLVDGRQIRHRHILFESNDVANRVFDELPDLRDSSDDEEPETFWQKRGATEVRTCGADPFPPGTEYDDN